MPRHRLPGGPVHRVPRGGGHPAPRLALVPGPHGAASPAARHYLPEPARGPRRRRGGGRHEVPPESRAGRLRRVSGRRETTTAADEVKLRSHWIWELLKHSGSTIIEPPLTTRTSANLGKKTSEAGRWRWEPSPSSSGGASREKHDGRGWSGRRR